jgi:hypothetical protein
MAIPDCLDIANALEDLAAGLRLDPSGGYDHLCWLCALHHPQDDAVVGYGLGLSEREAAADAWVGIQSLGELLDAIIDRRPLIGPDNRWRFELHPPGSWERTFAVHTTTTSTRTSPTVRHPVDRGGSYVSFRR